MRRSLPATLALVWPLIAAVPLASQPATPLSGTNWREVRSIRLGKFHSRVEVSSARRVRLVSQLDTSYLVSAELIPDSLKSWHQTVFSDLEKPARLKYTFENSILVEPFAAPDSTIGYVLTVADTNGAARTVVTDRDGIVEFLALLATGAAAAKTLTDSDLRRPGPVVETPIALAKSVSAVYPRTARLAGVNGRALVQFVVDTSGRAKPETINCLEATYKDFADAAVAAVRTMQFTPATLDGHKIEQLVQFPIEFKLHAVLPIRPFPVPTRPGRR